MLFPEGVAQHYFVFMTGRIFARCKIAPERRIHSQHRKKFCCNRCSRHLNRFFAASPGKRRGAAPDCGKRGEAPLVIMCGLKIEDAVSTVECRIARTHQISCNDPVRLRVGEWPENYCIHHAEDCRVSAYAERQREDCRQCEGWITHDLPQSIACILQQRFK